MSLLEHSKKYMSMRLAEGSAKPHLHRYTSEVYKRYLHVIDTNPDEYTKEIGDMFEVMQAEELDRQANLSDLHRSLGNEKRAAGHDKLFKVISDSTGFGDLFMKKSTINQELGSTFLLENDKRNNLMELMNNLSLLARSLPEEQEYREQLVKIAWYELEAVDTSLSWEKIKTEPSYRYCLYHTDAQLNFLEPFLKTALA